MTSVEFLINHLTEYGFRLEEHKAEIIQAEERHKQEMINTFKDAQVLKVMNDETRAEQYYYSTFKKD
jgi:hypothetical protein